MPGESTDVHALGALDVVGPDVYAELGQPLSAWRTLRRESPMHWFDLPGGVGFWAVTRRADIVWLSKQPERFINAPRLAIFEEGAPVEGERTFARQLLNMDPPTHGAYRAPAAGWFTPRATQRRRPEVERIARELLDGLDGDGEFREVDFVNDYAAPLTLGVLADMLGVPRADWKKMFEWTNQVAGSADPEFSGDADAAQSLTTARNELFAYFAALAEERRKDPRDDIVSVLVQSEVEGGPIPIFELLSYFFVLVVAGNETTRNAASGGLLAMIEHPDQWQRLRAEPGLIDSAVEEIVRWTSPVNQFCRTATEDLELHGQSIRKGDAFCLFYGSANRDESVFEDP